MQITRTKEEGRGAWDTAAKIPHIMEIGMSVGNGEACADMIQRMLNESLFGGVIGLETALGHV